MDLMVSRVGDRWQARFGSHVWHCAAGRGGVRRDKRKGDGATPAGRWPLRRVLYRADRLAAPQSRLPLSAIGPQDACCDDPSDPDYNRQVTLPFTGGHERLWREDEVDDVVAVLGHNDDPPLRGQRDFSACRPTGLRADRGLHRPGAERSLDASEPGRPG